MFTLNRFRVRAFLPKHPAGPETEPARKIVLGLRVFKIDFGPGLGAFIYTVLGPDDGPGIEYQLATFFLHVHFIN